MLAALPEWLDSDLKPVSHRQTLVKTTFFAGGRRSPKDRKLKARLAGSWKVMVYSLFCLLFCNRYFSTIYFRVSRRAVGLLAVIRDLHLTHLLLS